MSYQTKVDAYHGVEAWISGTHLQKYLPHGAEVFLHASLLNVIFLLREPPSAPVHQRLVKKGRDIRRL